MKLTIHITIRFLKIFLAISSIALLLLLLERMVRIVQLILDKNQSLTTIVEIMSTLLPHYVGVAIPLAFMMSVIIITYQLSISQEFIALKALGMSHFQIARPFFILSFIFCFISFLLLGYIKPMGRYYYRVLINEIENTEVFLLAKDGIFLRHDNHVMMVENVSKDQHYFKNVFLYQKKDHYTHVINSQEGVASSKKNYYNLPIIQLKKGTILTIKNTSLASVSPSQKTHSDIAMMHEKHLFTFPEKNEQWPYSDRQELEHVENTTKNESHTLSTLPEVSRDISLLKINFNVLHTDLNSSKNNFSDMRGSRMIELYISELLHGILSYHSPVQKIVIPYETYVAYLIELLYRLSYILIFPCLVLLTFPLAIVNARRPRYGKIVFAVLVFIFFYKLIDNAKYSFSHNENLVVIAQIGTYLSFLISSFVIFMVSNYTVTGIIKSRCQRIFYTYVYKNNHKASQS